MTDDLIDDEITDVAVADVCCDAPVSRRIAFPATRSLTSMRTARGAGRVPWPRVGGVDMPVRESSLFESTAFLDRWRPSGEKRAIYVAGCSGARTLAVALGTMLYKVSTTSPALLWRRSQQLRTDRYGAAWIENGKPVVDLEGWANWFSSQIWPNTRSVSPGAPIEIGPRSIIVTLPETMSAAAFDDSFDIRVGRACLADWIESEAGVNYCQLMGLDRARFCRYTAYEAGGAMRLSPARELSVFSIFQDTDRLIQIAEDILLEHYGLLSPLSSAG